MIPTLQGRKSRDMEKVLRSSVSFWGFIQNNAGWRYGLVSLCPGHLGQQGPAPSATKREVHSHCRNCTVTGRKLESRQQSRAGGLQDEVASASPQAPTLLGTLIIAQ